ASANEAIIGISVIPRKPSIQGAMNTIAGLLSGCFSFGPPFLRLDTMEASSPTALIGFFPSWSVRRSRSREVRPLARPGPEVTCWSAQRRGEVVEHALARLLGGRLAEEHVLAGTGEDVLELAAALRGDLGGLAQLVLDGFEEVDGLHVRRVQIGHDRL